MRVIKFFLSVLLLLGSQLCFATSPDLYPFTKPQQQEQFSRLTTQIRCLICQNETIADSSAPIANDLRKKVYDMINDGNTDQQIKRYLVDRYGDFVLFKPRLTMNTVVLWTAPIFFLGLGFLLLFIRVRRSNVVEVKQ